jgi:hypothetical protein
VVLDFGTRAQDFLKRITPLAAISPPTATLAPSTNSGPQVRFRRLRLPRPPMEPRPPPQRLRRHLLPQVQTPQHHRRYLPRSNPRPQTPGANTGVVFYRSGLFAGRIVLDQNWALEAIYAIFDRKKILPLLRGYGRFSRADLEGLIWSDYTPEEQRVFLGMMESCGICFEVRSGEYLAPELLPGWSGVQKLLFTRFHNDPPDAEATARYVFLHEGVMRGYLSKLGNHAKDAAIYWRYGCWFYEQKTRSQVLIETRWDDAATEAGAGDIRFRAWGERADDLIEQLFGRCKRCL